MFGRPEQQALRPEQVVGGGEERVPLTQFATARLDFAAPMAAGRAAYKVYLMSDSYVGVDQELDVEINVLSDDEGMAC